MKHLKILGEYVGHLAIGAAMFAALLMFGGALNLLVHWLGPLIGDESFTDCCDSLKRSYCTQTLFSLFGGRSTPATWPSRR